jgi:ParB family chromosome partitioning protein
MSKTMDTQKARMLELFVNNSYDNLISAHSGGRGHAQLIKIDLIDEDPNQPRQSFDQEELESLAASIRLKGIIQPIVVRPPVNGRNLLAFGARRLRAAKLTALTEIPAVIRDEEADDFVAQVIENQQRSNLSNAELAPVIAKLSADGYTKQQIRDICNLPEHAVSAFRQVEQFPLELSSRLNKADIRALYDLYRQWSKTPTEIIAALPDPDTFLTITEARRIIGGITGKPTGSIVLDRTSAPNPTSALPAAPKDLSHDQHPYRSTETNDTPDTDFTPHTPLPTATVQPARAQDTNPQNVSTPHSPPEPPPATERPTSVPQPSPDTSRQSALVTPTLQSHSAPTAVAVVRASTPTFIVHHKGRHGRLVINRRSDRQNHALVQFETGIEPIAVNDLEFVRID